nr:HAD hydrolase family protein [Desulforhopalus singaporensis]
MSSDCPSSPGNYPSDCQVLENYRTRVREKTGAETDPARKLALSRGTDIKLLLLDVDGVLTDGNLLYTSGGEEAKAFNTQDGFGIRLLRESGIETGIITARQSEIVARRAEELKIRYVYQGQKSKNGAFRQILTDAGLKPFEVAYMGDDWLDLCILVQVGLAIAPANGVDEVKNAAHYVTEKSGGSGAVREACSLILEAKKMLPGLLQKYTNR